MTRVMVVGVLGPLMLQGPDGPVRLGSARQRRLLAALAAHLGSSVSADQLADLVWGDELPADPGGALQTNVARLRRCLPAGVRIATTPEGYRLVADREVVDATAFTDHLATVAALTDPHARLEQLVTALALWRGRPYAELDHPSLDPEVARLTELRAAATEQHGEALLAVGRATDAIAVLEALTVAEPLREGAVGLLMRALVAAGRQSDALAAFSRLRTRLADELGLDPGPELRALEQQVLRQELPARSAPPQRARPAVALPVSSFVGREAEVTDAAELLGRARVVTLCGPGGVGKTRLARHVAAQVAGRYDDGVLLVEFGEGGPADVEPLVAAALRLAGPGTFAERIVEVLAVRRQLLVLDNCEHVADEVAGLVERVAAGAPGVDMLLTSREKLRVDGEHVLVVEPLAPAAAAALLADRIGAGDPAARPGDAEAGEVAEICRRLDRLPLALELAAARVVSLGLRGLLDALDEPLDVLRGGRRTAAPRHRSLRDVVAWSHGLLDDEQRALFEQLAVFAGPVERSAVVAVCGESSAALPDLVDRSLVVRHSGEPARFGMLETLRAFGRSRLAASSQWSGLRERHAAWAARLAEEVTVGRLGPAEAAAVRRFDAHLPDLRRAHNWLCGAGPVDQLLRLTLPFGELGYFRGRIDLVRVLERTLQVVGAIAPDGGAGPGVVPHPLVARLLGLLASAGWQRGSLARAESWSWQAIAVAEAAGDPPAARYGHEALANVLSFRGDLAGAREHGLRALELAEASGDDETRLLALIDLAVDAAYAGDHDSAAQHEAVMIAAATRPGSPSALAFQAYARGERLAERGDPEAARHLQTAIRLAEQADSAFIAGIARHTLLTSAARGAGPAQALAGFGPLIDHWHGLGAWTQLWIAVRALAEALSRLGRHEDAAVLLGASDASEQAPRPFGADSVRLQAVEEAARAALGPAFPSLRARGAELGDARAVALARRLARSAGADAVV